MAYWSLLWAKDEKYSWLYKIAIGNIYVPFPSLYKTNQICYRKDVTNYVYYSIWKFMRNMYVFEIKKEINHEITIFY